MTTDHGVRRLADAFFMRNAFNGPKPRNRKARASHALQIATYLHYSKNSSIYPFRLNQPHLCCASHFAETLRVMRGNNGSVRPQAPGIRTSFPRSALLSRASIICCTIRPWRRGASHSLPSRIQSIKCPAILSQGAGPALGRCT